MLYEQTASIRNYDIPYGSRFILVSVTALEFGCAGFRTDNEVLELRSSARNDILPSEQANCFQPSISSTPLKGLAGQY